MPDRHADSIPDIAWGAIWIWRDVVASERRLPIDARMRAAVAMDHFGEWGVRHA